MRSKVRDEKNWMAITIQRETVKQLKEIGKMSETYDVVIKRLIKEYLENLQRKEQNEFL